MFELPSPAWTAEDRLRVVRVLLELVERDVREGKYGRPGRPNFTSIYHVIHEDAAHLEAARSSVVEVFELAKRERAERTHPTRRGVTH